MEFLLSYAIVKLIFNFSQVGDYAMASSVGKCALCGKEGALEFEHIPPRSAFNKRRVREYSIEQLIEANRLPWEFEGLKYAENQRGSGLYSLCKSCNESTGSWYGTAYKIMTTHVIEGIKSLKNRSLEEYSIKIMDVFPARFLKQVISLFCSVNCVDLGKSYFENIYFDELRAFVLQKDAVGLDTGNFKVCMAIT